MEEGRPEISQSRRRHFAPVLYSIFPDATEIIVREVHCYCDRPCWRIIVSPIYVC